jgi:L-lactate utilization protein LutB
MIAWLRRLFARCEHQYIFLMIVDDSHLRSGYNHRSKVYKCVRCGKCETREELP